MNFKFYTYVYGILKHINVIFSKCVYFACQSNLHTESFWFKLSHTFSILICHCKILNKHFLQWPLALSLIKYCIAPSCGSQICCSTPANIWFYGELLVYNRHPCQINYSHRVGKNLMLVDATTDFYLKGHFILDFSPLKAHLMFIFAKR